MKTIVFYYLFMNFQKYLKESQGLIDKDGVQWLNLCDLIVEYIYDLQHGLNSDPFYDEDYISITKSVLESYYQYKHSKQNPSYIFPKWIHTFNVILLKDKVSSGTFLKKEAKLSGDNKLIFTIEINDYTDINPDSMHNTLIHEFQHAYSTWLELTKNINIYNKRDIELYNHAQTGFDNKKYGNGKLPLSQMSFNDFLEINDEVFDNTLYMERILLTSFYYIDKDEIRSFIQEFGSDMMKIIKKNIKTLQSEIKEANKFKGNFNNISKSEQWSSNILNNISINCYDSKYFKIYKSYESFFKKLMVFNLDEEIASEVVDKLNKPIKTFLNKKTELNKFDGDATKILQEIAKRQLKIFNNVTRKMEKIFAYLILQIPVKRPN